MVQEAGQCGVLGITTGAATIEKVGITGTIKGVGGAFFWDSYNGEPGTSFNNCYARCNLAGQNYDQGGFMCNWRNCGSPTFTNCYFAGTLSATGRVGGIMASPTNDNSTVRGRYTSCYYNSQLFTVTSAANPTPLTTSQFANKNNFTGWDFVNTWYIDSTTGYPELKF